MDSTMLPIYNYSEAGASDREFRIMEPNLSTTTLLEANVTTVNVTELPVWKPVFHSFEHLIATSVLLGLLIVSTIIGNVFVVAAVILERHLHNVANYLIVSLAIADLMVASLVMPLSIVSEVSKVWFLGAEVCDMWISFDVLCCTASILHLVAIAMDRYWAVTNIDYIRTRSAKRIITMIVMIWTFAMGVSIPPLFGWKDIQHNPDITGTCIISQDLGYTVYSTLAAFYVPMLFMLVIYVRIFQVARARIHKQKFAQKKKAKLASAASVCETASTLLPPSPLKMDKRKYDSSEKNNCTKVSNGKSNGHVEDDCNSQMLPTVEDLSKIRNKQKERLEAKRERKAARTLGIITGAFIICWLPFFILALLGPFVRDILVLPPMAFSVALWLGYFNSFFNPIIYTIFSPDFRNAFRKILFGKYIGKIR